MKEKIARLKKEIDFFKAKEKKLGQCWDKNIPAITKIEYSIQNKRKADKS